MKFRNSVKKFGASALAVVGAAVATPALYAQVTVEDPMGAGQAVSAFGTTLGAIGASALLLGLGFLVAYKGWRMISRFVK